MVTEHKPTQINRVTTQQTTIVPETSSYGATLYEDYYKRFAPGGGVTSTDRYYKPQVLRFHIMATMPGQVEVCTSDGTTTCDATCRAGAGCQEPAAIDYDHAKAVIWDLRRKDETLQWPLQDCGDTVVNATMFEECDYRATPNPASDSSYVYPTNSQPYSSAVQGTA